MVDQVASLVLKVDSTQAKSADADLDNLAKASQKAEAAVDGLGSSSKSAGSGVSSLRQAAQNARVQTDAIGMSAKQTANAMRMLPAQMTDITVGLTTGQSPFMVMMQQGGQLKDMFGGIGPAARAVGGYVAGLVNPFTLAAAGAAALAVAYFKGSQEAERFNESILLTGNYAGVTSGQLADMAARISDTVGTTGSAAEALAKLVGSGKLAGAAIEDLGRSAARMEQATGKSVDETIKEYERIADAPAEAIAKLNERYHFLTTAVYEQITALEKEGRQQDAARLALSTYSQAMEQRAGEIQKNIGLIEKAWDSVGKAAKWAWDQMLSIGREATPQERIAEIQDELNQIGDSFFHQSRASALRAQLTGLQDLVKWQNAAAKAESDRAEAVQRDIEGRRNLESYVGSRSGTSLKAALAAETEAFQKATATFKKDSDEYQKALKVHNDKVAQLEKQFAGPKGSSSLAAGVRLIEQARQRQAVLEQQLDSSEKLSTAQQELAKFEQQVADIKAKQTLTASEKSVLAEEAATRAVLERNVELQKEIQLRQELVQLQVMQRAAADTLATDRANYANQLEAFGLGPRAREQVQAQQRLYEDFRRQSQSAARDFARGQLSEEGYNSQMEVLRQNLDDRLNLQRKYYVDLTALESDWRMGARSGLAEYAEEAQNAAELTHAAFTTGLQGIEDFGVDVVTKLKFNFRDLGNVALSVLQDIARMMIRQNVTGPAASWLGTALNGVLGGLSSNWTTTSTSNPWSLGSLGLLGRASGGPTNPGQFYEVNERGPELYTEGNRTFLMSGARGGYVTPLAPPVGASSAGARVSVHNYGGAEVQARQMSDGEIMVEIDRRIERQTPRIMQSQFSSSNSRGSRGLASNFSVDRRR